MQIDKGTISAIKAFIEKPSVNDQEEARCFLDACRALLQSAREHHFGCSPEKEVGPEVTQYYYRKTVMPALSAQLSLQLNPLQLETAAQYITSLGSAISNQMTSGSLTKHQTEKLNGLVGLLEVFANKVLNKIDDRKNYYRFEDDYASVVRLYVGASASKPRPLSFFDSVASFFPALNRKKSAEDLLWPYSPRGEAHKEDNATAKLTEGSKKNADKDFDTDVSKKGPGSGPYTDM